MRVTFVLPFAGLAGGIRVAAIYARELHRRGHTVTAVSLTPRRPDFRHKLRSLLHLRGWATGVETEKGHFHDVPFEHRVLPHTGPVTAEEVPDADVVIGTWWETAQWINDFPASKGAKVYFIQHDETQFDYHDGSVRQKVEATWRMPMYKIVVAQWLADLARGKYDVSQVAVVPNGVDLEQFQPSGERQLSRPPTVGFVYARSHFKAVDVMNEAVELARRQEPKLKLVAFGATVPEGNLALPEPNTFHLKPEQESLREIYSAADVWLMGSRSEGFGLPILEAMACGTPVVATPTGAAPELLAGGGGLLAKPQDALDIARNLLKITGAGEEPWRQYSQAALATAQQHAWGRSHDAFEGHLLRAAEGVPADRPPVRNEAVPA
jgi:glycosyltransferase involved in cell wall biosynthesis